MNFNGEEWWNNQVQESDEWKELSAWISKEIIEKQDVDDMGRFPGVVLPDVAEMENKATHVATNFSTLPPLLFQINPSEIQEGFLQDYQVTDVTPPLITNTNYHAFDDDDDDDDDNDNDDDEGKIGANDKKRIRLTDNQDVMPSSSRQASARNFNERKRRRDINNKIKALHDLIPAVAKRLVKSVCWTKYTTT
ncbi:hypothetical protein ZOSMA_239G00140 [Zostera marina]|uniref:BHLH domain-containing protein n=1 Tax=Zostera marina TaxID=29655 RepID=A0A0K9PHF2_ZOSMR|nr:hypothetical protein ZOSMA_239G00140 [Zostera marina]